MVSAALSWAAFWLSSAPPRRSVKKPTTEPIPSDAQPITSARASAIVPSTSPMTPRTGATASSRGETMPRASPIAGSRASAMVWTGGSSGSNNAQNGPQDVCQGRNERAAQLPYNGCQGREYRPCQVAEHAQQRNSGLEHRAENVREDRKELSSKLSNYGYGLSQAVAQKRSRSP